MGYKKIPPKGARGRQAERGVATAAPKAQKQVAQSAAQAAKKKLALRNKFF